MGSEVPEPSAESPAPRTLAFRRLGLVPYAEALALQEQLVNERRARGIGDTVLFLEHPAVITRGVRNRASTANLLVSADEIGRRGVELFETGRGGDVTYHGPGQLVGYPILDLRPDRCDVHRYVRDLEEVLIRAIALLGVTGVRVPGITGVWVGPEGRESKIAAIGIRISRWVTSHGFALNVSTDLSPFQLIVPCGIADRGITSLERVAGRPVSMLDAENAVEVAMKDVFEP